MNKNIWIGVLVLTTLLFAVLYFSKPVSFGNATGPAHYQEETFFQGLDAGQRNQWRVTNTGLTSFSGAYATTSTGSETLAASDLIYPTVVMTPNLAALTVTLPTATTLGSSFLPNTGDRMSFVLYNATSTGAAIITLAGNTGTTLVSASSTKLVLAGYYTTIEAIRTSATTLVFRMTGN